MGRAEAFGAASASSNMRKGAARPTRAKGVCATIPDRRAGQWVGNVSEISSNSAGKGVLCKEIAPRVQVVTWPARRRGVTREDPMNDLTRRDALKVGGATVAAAL
jgi:hypothetical protein